MEESSRLSARVRAMEPGAFLECLQLCFEQLLLPMQRVSVMHAFLEEQMDLELMRLIEKHKVTAGRSHPHHGANRQACRAEGAKVSAFEQACVASADVGVLVWVVGRWRRSGGHRARG